MGIKEKLKNSNSFMRLYDKLLPYYCIYFTKPAVKMLYKQTFQKPLDLEHPKDLNEKINWLKIYRYKNDPLVAKCADKYRVREYVQENGCEEILNELYGVYYDYRDVDFDILPNQFVLKLNRGAGMNFICEDKSNLNIQQVRNMMKSWFHSECGERYGELHYRKSKPCIICEKYLGDNEGNYPVDYKVYTFGGKAHCVEICVGRKEHVKFLYVDTNYHRIDYGRVYYDGSLLPPKPECFEKMIEYAEKLSKPFCHVRMDFYVYKEQIILGEMTFTNSGGFENYFKQETLDIMGDLLVLPKEK
jgi:hypothetical protein